MNVSSRAYLRHWFGTLASWNSIRIQPNECISNSLWKKSNSDVTCDCFFCSALFLSVRSFRPSLVQCVNRLIIQAKRNSQIHPSKLCFRNSNCNILFFSIPQKNFTQFVDLLTFGIAYICTFRAKLDYHTSKLQPQQHIDRDKHSSPISAGWYLVLCLFFCFQSHFTVWNQITKKQTWNVSCDIFKRKIPLSSNRIVFGRNENFFVYRSFKITFRMGCRIVRATGNCRS